MKSVKITNKEATPVGRVRERWYDDACGTAMALEFVGERWSLLVLRELMFGPRRFGEIKAHLTGVSANVLTQRLENLERAGMLVRRRLPSPANAQVYELTPWGYEIEPVLQTMGRWATRSPAHDPTLPLSPASAMLSLRTMIDRDKARAMTGATIGFRLGGDRFVARLTADDLVIVRGEPMGVDVTIDTDPTTLAVWIYVKRPIAAAEAAGTMRIEGDRALAERFADLFALPAKISNEGELE